MTAPRSKKTTVIYAARRWQPVTPYAHAKLPPARAWRVVAARADLFSAAAPAVAAGLAPAAPAGTLDGAYPVWVRLTDPTGRTPDAGLIIIDHDGWNLEETGPDWRIEMVGVGGLDDQHFAYYVETADDAAEAGQVNRGAAPPYTPAWTPAQLNPLFGGANPDWISSWQVPTGTGSLIIYHRNVDAATTTLKGVRMYDAQGNPIHGTATDLFGAAALNLTAADAFFRPHFAFGAQGEVAGLGVRAGALVPYVATHGPPPARVDITLGSAAGAIVAGQVTLQGHYW